jgi:hypothetical protein
VPDWGWFLILGLIAGVVFWLLETRFKPASEPTASEQPDARG